jgi:hypothetical protein
MLLGKLCQRLSLLVLVIGLYFSFGIKTTAFAADDLLLNSHQFPVRAEIHSKLWRFQQKLRKLSRHCIKKTKDRRLAFDKSGYFGRQTAKQIQAVLSCKEFKNVPSSSMARQGALTRSVWRVVMPHKPPPNLQDLAKLLILTFEATGFSDRPEWNFCQDSPAPPLDRARRVLKGAACINQTDRCSMLTWGPRGATAGQGREIQWILHMVERRNNTLLIKAFGSETNNLLRFLHLKAPPPQSCNGSSPLEHFMCAVWTNPSRRRIWSNALMELGSSPLVRKIYQQLYADYKFDGYKLRDYYRLWALAGIDPSEIDYAFFLDRATHIGGPPPMDGKIVHRFLKCTKTTKAIGMANARARRCLSLHHPHPTMPTDRLGRDVAYYIDTIPIDRLSQKEFMTWDRHIPLRVARDFALSDERKVSIDDIPASKLSPKDEPQEYLSLLTKEEQNCPLRIRSPISFH